MGQTLDSGFKVLFVCFLNQRLEHIHCLLLHGYSQTLWSVRADGPQHHPVRAAWHLGLQPQTVLHRPGHMCLDTQSGLYCGSSVTLVSSDLLHESSYQTYWLFFSPAGWEPAFNKFNTDPEHPCYTPDYNSAMQYHRLTTSLHSDWFNYLFNCYRGTVFTFMGWRRGWIFYLI